MSKKLTIEEKEEIRVLYRTGEWSMGKLGEKFGCSKMTIKRTIDATQIKIAPPPKEEPPPEPSPRVMPFTYDPIQFRIQKFQEISLSIDNMEQRGTNPAQLHKLQIDLHDQITERIREQNGGANIENEEELLLVIQQAVIGLPPILREQLLETLSDDYSNIIPLEGEG